MVEEEKHMKELEALKKEHRELDENITRATTEGTKDQLSLQRMKKRKLWLRDRIAVLYSILYDDIIA